MTRRIFMVRFREAKVAANSPLGVSQLRLEDFDLTSAHSVDITVAPSGASPVTRTNVVIDPADTSTHSVKDGKPTEPAGQLVVDYDDTEQVLSVRLRVGPLGTIGAPINGEVTVRDGSGDTIFAANGRVIATDVT